MQIIIWFWFGLELLSGDILCIFNLYKTVLLIFRALVTEAEDTSCVHPDPDPDADAESIGIGRGKTTDTDTEYRTD